MSCGRLIGKTALVTGGGSGIGRAICQLFAKEGASVALMDVDRQGAQETLGLLERKDSTNHCFVTGDVTNVADIKMSLASAKETIGTQPNILVNNAAVIRGGLIDTVTEEALDDVINVNLKGVYLMAKHFILSLKESNDGVRGTIVNVSSMAGQAGFGMNSDYAAAKAGVIGLSKTIALEFHWHRIRCNTLLPGFTDTPMAAKADPILRKKLVRHHIPMKRLAQPEEIANACLFLASDESSYVHGACLEVSGGLR